MIVKLKSKGGGKEKKSGGGETPTTNIRRLVLRGCFPGGGRHLLALKLSPLGEPSLFSFSSFANAFVPAPLQTPL